MCYTLFKGIKTLSAELRIRVKGENPATWATGDQSGAYFSYNENEYGEQWVAKREGNVLLISGLDIGWEEFRLNAEQAIAERDRILEQIIASAMIKEKYETKNMSKSALEMILARQLEYIRKLPS